ncbi:MAG: RDD family protein [Dehalococcoidia bacterium]
MPPVLLHSVAVASAVTRRARLGAAALDALALLPPLAVAGIGAVVWLLARTAWGRDDPSGVDASVALALVAAAPGAWLARVGHALVLAHATPGQHARGLRVERTREVAPDRGAYALRLALHPFGAVGWALTAGTLYLAAAPEAALTIAAIAAIVATGGAVALAIVLVAPDARALHDRIAGTRVVRA